MARQILKVQDAGFWYSVVKTDDPYNPYSIYRHSIRFDKYNYPRESKRLVEKYADMGSCLYYLASEHPDNA